MPPKCPLFVLILPVYGRKSICAGPFGGAGHSSRAGFVEPPRLLPGGSPRSRPRGALALVGAWGEFVEDDEIDAMLEEIYAARERDTGRPVDLEA